MIGRTVGTYKILEKIGEGGMGAVYKGVDLMLERTVAVKVLRPELGQQPRVVERFRSEAVTLARLNHPNIATLYSFLQEGPDFFMVLEFVQGRTLEDMLKRGGAMPCEQALPLFCQALDGIAHAHAQGIIHRDVKPANVMLTDTGGVKVMDFGIARVLGTARMTRTGHLIGTIEYMSPEQVRGQETDARSDIYSLGILLYEMLTGRVPFEADSDFGLMQAHVKKTPRPLRALTPSVPTDVERAVLRALAKKPEARFQDAASFRGALEAVPQATAQAGADRATSGVMTRLRRLFAPTAETSPTAPGATRLAEEAPAATPPAAVKETRLPDAKETRLATDAGTGGAATSHPLLATWRLAPPWKYAAAAAPVLLAVLALVFWMPKPGPDDGPIDPAADTTDVANADTLAVRPVDPSGDPRVPVVQNQIPSTEPPVARDRPRLLSPEEFARLNPGEDPSPADPAPETPAEQRPASPSEPQRAEARAEDKPEAARLGALRILVRPFGDVYVDGSRKARATNQPYTEALAAGTYRVRAVHPTYGAWEKEVTVQAGEQREVLFNFNAEYRVTVTSEPPNAEILVDGTATGRYTPSVVTVRPGHHTVSVRKDGYTVPGGARRLQVEGAVKDPVHFTLQRRND